MALFLEKISRDVFLFDGGIGTQLQASGLPVGDAPEKWNLERPEIVERVHADYAAAGAMAVTTNSFGGSPVKLQSAGLEIDAVQLNRRAAELARSGAGADVLVAGSVGPSGMMLITEQISPQELGAGFEAQARGLVEGGIDLFIVETMSDPEEVKIAIEAIRRVSDLPLIACMTFESGVRGYRTMMGTDIAAAVKTLIDARVDVIGTNCGAGIDQAIDVVTEMAGHSDGPILAQPNAGLPELVQGRTVYRESPEQMAEKLPGLIAAGARIVGGCCGTTPEHIRRFAAVLSEQHEEWSR